jgi:uncharacterized membrane protein
MDWSGLLLGLGLGSYINLAILSRCLQDFYKEQSKAAGGKVTAIFDRHVFC